MRRWRMNGVVPLGSTVQYQCPKCHSEISLRTPWHLLMLVVCLAALVFVLPVVYMRNEVIATAFGAAVLIYVVYALVTDTLDRRRNPKWG